VRAVQQTKLFPSTMKSFYITLPGGVKSTYHDNVLSDYVTHLSKTVELTGKWEVGLVELHLTKSWFNVSKDMWIGVRDTNDRVDRHPDSIPSGKYDIRELLMRINTILATYKRYKGSMADYDMSGLRNPRLNNAIVLDAPQLLLDEYSKTIHMSVGTTDELRLIFPDMDQSLLQMLGLTNRLGPHRYYSIIDGKRVDDFVLEQEYMANLSIKGFLFAERAYDIEQGVHAVYVYSDIVEENLIGDTSAQCLRVCTLPTKQFGETINLQFDTPHYVPVSSRSFQTIRISLKDSTNEKIKFQFGDTLVKLHFRQYDL